MTHEIRAIRRARPATARTAAAIIAAAALALLAACGTGSRSAGSGSTGSGSAGSGGAGSGGAGSGSAGSGSAGSGSSPASSGAGGAGSGSAATAAGAASSQTGVEYANCMRSHGVPRYPDPTSRNELPSGLPKVSPEQLGVSSSQFQAAQNDCAHLLPNGGQLTQAQSQQDLDAMRRFAQCMRSHGVPTWPDPTDDSAGWGFNLLNVQGFDPNSAQIEQKMTDCQRALPPGIGVPLSRPGVPG